MDPIIKHNLKLMTTQMLEEIAQESIGGNAGVHNKMPAVALNFYFDESGKIIEFTNKTIIKKGLAEATYRLVLDLTGMLEGKKPTRRHPEIIQLLFTSLKVPKKAKINLILSMRIYNEYGKRGLLKHQLIDQYREELNKTHKTA